MARNFKTSLAAIEQAKNQTGDKIVEPVNYDMLAMQIFSTFKTNIIPESLRDKKPEK